MDEYTVLETLSRHIALIKSERSTYIPNLSPNPLFAAFLSTITTPPPPYGSDTLFEQTVTSLKNTAKSPSKTNIPSSSSLSLSMDYRAIYMEWFGTVFPSTSSTGTLSRQYFGEFLVSTLSNPSIEPLSHIHDVISNSTVSTHPSTDPSYLTNNSLYRTLLETTSFAVRKEFYDILFPACIRNVSLFLSVTSSSGGKTTQSDHFHNSLTDPDNHASSESSTLSSTTNTKISMYLQVYEFFTLLLLHGHGETWITSTSTSTGTATNDSRLQSNLLPPNTKDSSLLSPSIFAAFPLCSPHARTMLTDAANSLLSLYSDNTGHTVKGDGSSSFGLSYSAGIPNGDSSLSTYFPSCIPSYSFSSLFHPGNTLRNNNNKYTFPDWSTFDEEGPTTANTCNSPPNSKRVRITENHHDAGTITTITTTNANTLPSNPDESPNASSSAFSSSSLQTNDDEFTTLTNYSTGYNPSNVEYEHTGGTINDPYFSFFEYLAYMLYPYYHNYYTPTNNYPGTTYPSPPNENNPEQNNNINNNQHSYPYPYYTGGYDTSSSIDPYYSSSNVMDTEITPNINNDDDNNGGEYMYSSVRDNSGKMSTRSSNNNDAHPPRRSNRHKDKDTPLSRSSSIPRNSLIGTSIIVENNEDEKETTGSTDNFSPLLSKNTTTKGIVTKNTTGSGSNPNNHPNTITINNNLSSLPSTTGTSTGTKRSRSQPRRIPFSRRYPSNSFVGTTTTASTLTIDNNNNNNTLTKLTNYDDDYGNANSTTDQYYHHHHHPDTFAILPSDRYYGNNLRTTSTTTNTNNSSNIVDKGIVPTLTSRNILSASSDNNNNDKESRNDTLVSIPLDTTTTTIPPPSNTNMVITLPELPSLPLMHNQTFYLFPGLPGIYFIGKIIPVDGSTTTITPIMNSNTPQQDYRIQFCGTNENNKASVGRSTQISRNNNVTFTSLTEYVRYFLSHDKYRKSFVPWKGYGSTTNDNNSSSAIEPILTVSSVLSRIDKYIGTRIPNQTDPWIKDYQAGFIHIGDELLYISSKNEYRSIVLPGLRIFSYVSSPLNPNTTVSTTEGSSVTNVSETTISSSSSSSSSSSATDILRYNPYSSTAASTVSNNSTEGQIFDDYLSWAVFVNRNIELNTQPLGSVRRYLYSKPYGSDEKMWKKFPSHPRNLGGSSSNSSSVTNHNGNSNNRNNNDTTSGNNSGSSSNNSNTSIPVNDEEINLALSDSGEVSYNYTPTGTSMVTIHRGKVTVPLTNTYSK